jgi:hypothetical protein
VNVVAEVLVYQFVANGVAEFITKIAASSKDEAVVVLQFCSSSRSNGNCYNIASIAVSGSSSGNASFRL